MRVWCSLILRADFNPEPLSHYYPRHRKLSYVQSDVESVLSEAMTSASDWNICNGLVKFLSESRSLPEEGIFLGFHNLLQVKLVLVKKSVKCKMMAKMSRISGIWRCIMGFERMSRDLWVAPPGGYLRYLGPSPLTAVQGVLNFFRHPFLICSSCLRMYKHFSWRATALGQQNLFCQQR